MNQIPNFKKGPIPDTPRFNLEEYIINQSQEFRAKYNNRYDNLVLVFFKAINDNLGTCQIIIERRRFYSDDEHSWKESLHYLDHMAINNFILDVKAKNYPCTYEIKHEKDGSLSDCPNYSTWGEINISLK